MQDSLIRLQDVEAKVGLKKSKIYALIAEGKFPAGIPITSHNVRWSSAEIDTWIGALKAERPGAAEQQQAAA